MKKVSVMLLTMILVLSMFTACAQAEVETATTEPGNETVEAKSEEMQEVDLTTKTVGLSMHFMQDDYAVFLVKAFEEVMDAAGVETVILSADANPEKQLADITSFITQQVDAIVVVPFDENAIMDKCNEAQAAGIPVISVTVMPQVDAYATIDGNDMANAYGATMFMLDAIDGQGQILQVDVPIEPYRIAERMKGFEKAMTEADAVLVDAIYSVDQIEIISLVKNAIAANPQINGIYGGFGTATAAIGEALKELDRKDIKVSGVDADFSIMNLIKEGYVTAAAAQYPSAHGTMAAEAALSALKGEPSPVGFQIPPYTIVNIDNVDEMAKTLWDKELE